MMTVLPLNDVRTTSYLPRKSMEGGMPTRSDRGNIAEKRSCLAKKGGESVRACHVATQNYKHTVPVVGNGKQMTRMHDNAVYIEIKYQEKCKCVCLCVCVY